MKPAISVMVSGTGPAISLVIRLVLTLNSCGLPLVISVLFILTLRLVHTIQFSDPFVTLIQKNWCCNSTFL